jgi:hypothetical protein
LFCLNRLKQRTVIKAVNLLQLHVVGAVCVQIAKGTDDVTLLHIVFFHPVRINQTTSTIRYVIKRAEKRVKKPKFIVLVDHFQSPCALIGTFTV